MADIPTKIGIFEVLRQIGSGGMGAVYLGRDPELDRQVAIKVIREEVHDQEVLDRFFREARAAAALRHANIITVYASGQENHRPYIAMEYIEGESFADIIKQRKNLPLTEKVSYLEQVCAGLAFAHKAGIVHRDVKPANIMIDREGVVRILDFGIARIEGSAMTQDGTMMGSLNYMSPEQMLGRPVDPRSDIFSVGSVSYEFLTYYQAFKGNLNDGLLHRLPHEDPPLLKDLVPSIPLAVEQVVMRALEKDPGRRFQTLSDMRAAFANALSITRPPTAVPVEPVVAEERTVVVERPKTNPPIPVVVTPPPTPAVQEAVSPAPRIPAPPPAAVPAPVPQPVPIRQPLAAVPPAASLKLKSEAATSSSPAASDRSRTAPRSTSPASINFQVAQSHAPASRRIPPAVPPQPQTASRKWPLIGAGVIVVAIGAAAAAIPWINLNPFNPPPLDPIVVERPKIEAAMNQYRSAYRNRNLEGVVEVFPELPADTRRSMQQAFTTCLVYEVTFDELSVALDADDPHSAVVDVRSTHTCTPNSGGRQTITSRQDMFSLKKIADDWFIAASAPVLSRRPQ